jgi:transcriptional regulator with XRE-family HTH domain
MPLKALEQLRQNIETLLRVRKEDQKTLALAIGVHPTTINKFLKRTRELQLADLDKVADFFGIATYQLFQPGISSLSERRQFERRGGRERRIGHAHRGMHVAAQDIQAHRPHRKDAPHVVVAPPPSPAAAELKRVIADFERLASRLLAGAESGGQAPGARLAVPGPRPRRRIAGGSDPPKP